MADPESQERLRRVMEDHGFVIRRDDDGTVPEHVATIRPVSELVPDTRLTNQRCAICVGAINPRRKVKVAEAEWAHRLCASAPQNGEWILRHWFALPLEVRRRRIILHFGLDPLACEQVPTEIEWLTFHDGGVDGLLSMEPYRRTHRRVSVVGVPNCWWSVAGERGWLG